MGVSGASPGYHAINSYFLLAGMLPHGHSQLLLHVCRLAEIPPKQDWEEPQSLLWLCPTYIWPDVSQADFDSQVSCFLLSKQSSNAGLGLCGCWAKWKGAPPSCQDLEESGLSPQQHSQ